MDNESFDFIIAGGGTAGVALAVRLSEVVHQKILVLEAGLDHSDEPRVKTPAFYAALFGTDMDWGFSTVPQEHLNGRNISVNQGKALGGSSVLNAQVYIPPTKAILEAWAELGNDGWNWDTMGPYYKKAFTLPQIPDELRRPLGIGNCRPDDTTTSGPVLLSFPGNSVHPIREIWAETFKRKGYLMPDNPWADASVGAFSNLASIDPAKKERVHSARAYYEPVKHRENLKIVVGAYVNKIIFADGQARPKAVGIQYTHKGKTKIASARKEIIIAAGALKSLGLLELSGIGNAGILKRNGIQLIKELSGVGENLQDHLLCSIRYGAEDQMDTLDVERKGLEEEEQATHSSLGSLNGLVTSSGILTYAYLPVMDFLTGRGRDKLINLIDENRPPVSTQPENVRARMYYDIAEKTLLDPKKPSAAYLTGIGHRVAALDPNTSLPMPPQIENHLAIVTILAQPLSRGTVHIASNDPTDGPEINPKYLSNPLDMEILAQHTMYIESIASSEPLRSVLKQPLQRSSPLAHITDLDAARRYIRSRAASMWHPAGTCAMLPETAGGVVDPTLKVYGVDGLRIVDASVVPLLPPGNLQSTVYAIAERAADLIKEEYGLSTV